MHYCTTASGNTRNAHAQSAVAVGTSAALSGQRPVVTGNGAAPLRHDTNSYVISTCWHIDICLLTYLLVDQLAKSIWQWAMGNDVLPYLSYKHSYHFILTFVSPYMYTTMLYLYISLHIYISHICICGKFVI